MSFATPVQGTSRLGRLDQLGSTHPVRLVAWSPVANGFFADDADLAAARFDAYRTADNLARRDRAAALGARRGLTTNQVALAWVLGQPFAPIGTIGTTSPAHLAEAVTAAGVRLTADELRWLEHGDGPNAIGSAPAEWPWTS